MSEEDAVREGAREAANTWLQEPAPVEEEVRRSVFASGLVQLLLGVAATTVVGLTFIFTRSTGREMGATRSAYLMAEQRRAAVVQPAQAEAPQQRATDAPPAEAEPIR